jgi:hypothetical protein
MLAPTSEGGSRVALLSFILVCSAGLVKSYSNYPTERSTDFLRGICLKGSGCRKRVLGFNAGTPVDGASTPVVTAPQTPPGSGSVDGVVSGDAAEAHCNSLVVEAHNQIPRAGQLRVRRCTACARLWARKCKGQRGCHKKSNQRFAKATCLKLDAED